MDRAFSLGKQRDDIASLEVEVQTLLFDTLVQVTQDVLLLPFVVQKQRDVFICNEAKETLINFRHENCSAKNTCDTAKIDCRFRDVERVLHSLRILPARLNNQT